MGPQLKVVERSRTATMLCAASGNPDPEITWFKDFLPVNTSSNNGRIKQLRSGNRCFHPFSLSLPFNPRLLFSPEGFSPSHFAFIPLSTSTPSYPPSNPFFSFCSYKASVILALVHPISYCCFALLLLWLLAVFLSCPSPPPLLLLWYQFTVCAVAKFSKLLEALRKPTSLLFSAFLPTF